MKNQHLKELAQFRLSNINGMDKLVADRDRRIAELESWVRGVEEAMISATDHAAAAERERDELKHIQELNVKIKQAMHERFTRAEAEIARRDAAAGEAVGLVELSDYMTAEELAGMKPRRVAVKELFEGALKVGDHIYTAAPPAALPLKYADELVKRAELIEAYSKTQCKIAQELGCDSDNESILKAIYDLKELRAQPQKPVVLQPDRADDKSVSTFDSEKFYDAGWNSRGKADKEALDAANVPYEVKK